MKPFFRIIMHLAAERRVFKKAANINFVPRAANSLDLSLTENLWWKLKK